MKGRGIYEFYRRKAEALAAARGSQGIEAEISLVLDMMLPAARVVDALKAFRVEFPSVSLRLYIEGLGAVTQMVLDGTATIGVCGALDEAVPGIERIAVGSVEWIPVAAPDHPLALADRNAPGAGRDHIQLVLTDRSPRTRGQDHLNVLSPRNSRTRRPRLADAPAGRLVRGGETRSPCRRRQRGALPVALKVGFTLRDGDWLPRDSRAPARTVRFRRLQRPRLRETTP
jgi:hypothetical protein